MAWAKAQCLGCCGPRAFSCGRRARRISICLEAITKYQASCSLANWQRYDLDAETVRTALEFAGVKLRLRNGWPTACFAIARSKLVALER